MLSDHSSFYSCLVWEALKSKTGKSKEQIEKEHWGKSAKDSKEGVESKSSLSIDKSGETEYNKEKREKAPIEFKTAKEGDSFFKAESEKLNSLDKGIRDAIQAYTTDSYIQINDYLRGNVGNWDENYIKKQIAEIDKAMDKFELKKDIVVYRAQPMLINTKKGDVLTFESYTSTTISTEPLQSDGGNLKGYWDVGAIFKITVPKGKRGMYINSVSAYADKEYEYLLKRNTKFKVKDIKTNTKEFKSKGELKIVELEVID